MFACNEAKLQQVDKTGCCPLMMTTSLFGESLRNQPDAWCPLGYAYDLGIIESSAETGQQTKDLKY